MKFLLWLFLVAFVTAAQAADNSVILTPGSGVTMRTKDVGSGVESPLQIPGDTSGNALATAPGTPNASFALPVQGVTSGTPVSVSSSTLATVAAQTGTSATTAHGCSTGGYGELGCLGQIDDDIKGPIAPQSAPYTIIGGVINGANTYNTVAASQTTQALTGGSGGATGDYLSHCVILPTTTAAGTVIIYDNSTAIFTFTTGTLSNLVPFTIPVGAVSVSGAWKVTTGANETATCVGKFH